MPRQDHEDLKSQSYQKKERTMSMEREENERNKEIEEGRTKALGKLREKAANASVDGSGNMKPTNPKDAVGIRKPRFYSGMSAHVERLVGIGMLEGAMKYGRHNYRPAAVRASVYYDATREHLASFWEGEDIDPDSKLPHVIKAICSLNVLADAIITGNLVDDRPPRTVGVREMVNAYQPIVDEIFARYPEPKAAFTQTNSKVTTMSVYSNPWLFDQAVNTSKQK